MLHFLKIEKYWIFIIVKRMIICNIKKSRMYDILYLDFYNVYVIFFLLLSVYYAHDNTVSKIHINISSTDAFFGVDAIYMFEFFSLYSKNRVQWPIGRKDLQVILKNVKIIPNVSKHPKMLRMWYTLEWMAQWEKMLRAQAIKVRVNISIY